MLTISKNFIAEKSPLYFYFDYISPYAYLSWKKIIPLCEKYNLVLKPEPIVLGAILSQNETKGPAEILSKRAYTFKDVLRSAKKDGVKIKFPPTHPFNPLPSLRATCLMENHEKYFQFISDLFNICWYEGKDLSDINLIRHVLRKYGAENDIEKIKENNIKEILKDKTNQALLKGVFGVPSILINDELFWGNDRFDFLEEYLSGKENIDINELERALQIPKGIERKEVKHNGK